MSRAQGRLSLEKIQKRRKTFANTERYETEKGGTAGARHGLLPGIHSRIQEGKRGAKPPSRARDPRKT